MSTRPVLCHALVAGVSLFLVSLAFYPADLWLLGYVGLVPWMLYHQRGPRPGTGRALMLGYYLHFAWMFGWVAEVAPPMVWLIPLMGMPHVFLMARLLDLAVHRLKLPATWSYAFGITGIEVFRQSFFAATWCPVGYTVWRQEDLLQTATVFGVYGMTFAVLAVNGGIATLIRWLIEGRRGKRPVIAALLGGAPLLLGHLWGGVLLAGMQTEPGPLAVGVQPNVELHAKVRGSEQARWKQCEDTYAKYGGPEMDPDILILPETVFWSAVLPEWPLERILRDRRPIHQHGTPGAVFPRGRGQLTVVGYSKREVLAPSSPVVDEDRDGFQEWNVAGVIRDGLQVLGEYEKREIVPFGEFLPLPAWFPWREDIKDMVRERSGYIPDLTRGTRPLLVSGEMGERSEFRFGITICYEIVFPRYYRELALEGADFSINISNDGWYKESAELDLVHVATRFRAVECRRSIFRVSNTGISTLVDPAGRYLDTVELAGARKSIPGILRGAIPICREETLYARFGLVPAYGFLVVFLGLLAIGLVRRRNPAP